MEQNENKNVDYGKKLAFWEFNEFQEHDRGLTWYIVIGVIFLGLLLYSVLSSDFLFTLIIFIGGATFIFGSFKKQPRKILFEIYQDGIVLNQNFTSFDDLKSFSIIYNPPEVKTLYFEQSSLLKGELSIPLEKQNPVRIREILLNYLKENLEKDDESFVDLIRRRAKL